jgi:hypothetical protein
MKAASVILCRSACRWETLESSRHPICIRRGIAGRRRHFLNSGWGLVRQRVGLIAGRRFQSVLQVMRPRLLSTSGAS